MGFFLSPFQGENTKMSASDSNYAIYVTNIHEEINNKVCLEHCFSEIYLLKNLSQQAGSLSFFLCEIVVGLEAPCHVVSWA
jgi:hypothetical protein